VGSSRGQGRSPASASSLAPASGVFVLEVVDQGMPHAVRTATEVATHKRPPIRLAARGWALASMEILVFRDSMVVRRSHDVGGSAGL
jgi:hypothetical protein